MKKSDFSGSTYIVLVDGEYAGWFNMAGPNTEILRAALSSNPTLIDMEDLEIDMEDLPKPADGYIWDGSIFKKGESLGN